MKIASILLIAVALVVGLSCAAAADPLNLALGKSASESDPGWGGGSYPQEITDGVRTYQYFGHGLAFTGGDSNWGGEPAGPRQATIDLGATVTFNRVVLWHRGELHIPADTSFDYWNGAEWIPIMASRNLGGQSEGDPTWCHSFRDEYRFDAVSGSKVRYHFDNRLLNTSGSQITHGWLYEFEVYNINNLALGKSASESDPGWGGGSYPQEITDGIRTYQYFGHGLAFTGGDSNWGGEPAGPRQATIDLGATVTLDQVILWHRGELHIPADTSFDYWNGAEWIPVVASRNLGGQSEGDPTWCHSFRDEYRFDAVSGSKVRYHFDNRLLNTSGSQITHGWLYEFEVYGYANNLTINPPYEYTWCMGQSVSDCLGASGGVPPYHDWTALASYDYTHTILGSSSFSPVGTAKGWRADDSSWSYTLPFAFPYYGSNRTSVNVCSNGFLDFTSTTTDYSNTSAELVSSVRIAPLWDDLNTSSGDIYVDEGVSGQVTIRWQGVTYSGSYPVNFAVVLFSDGRIRFDYGNGNTGLTPTVGISAGDGTNYILVPGYDGASSLTNSNSVLFTPTGGQPPLPPGVSLNPNNGCCSGAPTTAGDYSAPIQVSDSSSPASTVQEEFTFHVIAAPEQPTSPSANPSTICVGGSSTLSATPGSGGDIVVWYSGSCGGTPVTSPVNPTSTTTYFAKTKNSTTGCLSSGCAAGVTVTVNPLPVAPTSASPSPAMICSGASSTLTAMGGSGDELRWSTSCHGTVIGTGDGISVSPTGTTTYYAWWHNSCGDSDCASVTVTVNVHAYGVRISDVSHSPTPPNPIRVWGKVTSESPVKISDGRAEITVIGLTASLGDYLVVTGDWNGTVLTVNGGITWYVGPAGVEMIWIPAGSFLMGNSLVGDDASDGFGNELPQHSVTLSGYYIGKYEVTRGEYRAFMTATGRAAPQYWDAVQDWGTGSFTQTDNHPVVGVTWYDAEAFCTWAGGHLPTEAQWEKAARWTGSYPNVYPWGNTWDAEKCNNYYDTNSAGGGYQKRQTAPVASYASDASPSGCLDMAGNVREWCRDWFLGDYYSQSPISDPQGPAGGSYRVLRGGSWYYNGSSGRCAFRNNYGLSYSYDYVGFRLAR